MNKSYEKYLKWHIRESLRKVSQGKDWEKESSELFSKIRVLFD